MSRASLLEEIERLKREKFSIEDNYKILQQEIQTQRNNILTLTTQKTEQQQLAEAFRDQVKSLKNKIIQNANDWKEKEYQNNISKEKETQNNVSKEIEKEKTNLLFQNTKLKEAIQESILVFQNIHSTCISMGAPENKSSIEQVNQVQKFLDIANQGRIFGDNLLNQLSSISKDAKNGFDFIVNCFKEKEKEIDNLNTLQNNNSRIDYEKISNREAEIKQLEIIIKDQDRLIAKDKENLVNLENEFVQREQTLLSKINELESHVGTLKQTLNMVGSKNLEFDEMLEKITEECKYFQNHCKQLDIDKEMLSLELIEQKQICRQLKLASSIAEENYRKRMNISEKYEPDLMFEEMLQNHDGYVDLSAFVTAVKSQLYLYREQYLTVEAMNKQLEAQIEHMAYDRSTIENEIKKEYIEPSQYTSMKATLIMLQDNIALKSKELSYKNNQLSLLNEDLNKLKSEYMTMESSLHQLQSINKMSKKAMSQKDLLNKQLKTKIEDLQARINNIESVKSNDELLVKSLRANLMIRDNTIDRLRLENEHLSKQNNEPKQSHEMEDSIKKLKQDNINLRHRVTNITKQLNNQGNENIKLVLKNKTLEEELSRQTQRLDNVRKEIQVKRNLVEQSLKEITKEKRIGKLRQNLIDECMKLNMPPDIVDVEDVDELSLKFLKTSIYDIL